jgi:hypothetical protein
MMSLATQRKLTSQAIEDLWQNSFFSRYWRAIGTFLGRGKAVSIWVSAAVVMIVNLLLGVSISALLGESRFISTQVVLTNLMWVTSTYSAILLFFSLHSRLLEFLRLRLVALIETEQHLQDLQAWAKQWLGWKLPQFLFSVGFASIAAPVGFNAIYDTTNLSIGVVLIYFINYFHLGIAVYGLISLISFLLRLRNWSLMLYPDDPGSSPILLQLSDQLRDYILQYSFSIALFMLLASFVGGLNMITIAEFLIVSWIPILAVFILGHYAFSSLITRVKHERMGVLQSKIMNISKLGQIDTKTTAQIMSLMDYHDRVKTARNSLINSQAIVNLGGSLALPLLATLVQAYVQNLFK